MASLTFFSDIPVFYKHNSAFTFFYHLALLDRSEDYWICEVSDIDKNKSISYLRCTISSEVTQSYIISVKELARLLHKQ